MAMRIVEDTPERLVLLDRSVGVRILIAILCLFLGTFLLVGAGALAIALDIRQEFLLLPVVILVLLSTVVLPLLVDSTIVTFEKRAAGASLSKMARNIIRERRTEHALEAVVAIELNRRSSQDDVYLDADVVLRSGDRVRVESSQDFGQARRIAGYMAKFTGLEVTDTTSKLTLGDRWQLFKSAVAGSRRRKETIEELRHATLRDAGDADAHVQLGMALIAAAARSEAVTGEATVCLERAKDLFRGRGDTGGVERAEEALALAKAVAERLRT